MKTTFKIDISPALPLATIEEQRLCIGRIIRDSVLIGCPDEFKIELSEFALDSLLCLDRPEIPDFTEQLELLRQWCITNEVSLIEAPKEFYNSDFNFQPSLLKPRLRGCQSYNHAECGGFLWICDSCARSLCCEEGADNGYIPVCDSCNSELENK